MIKKIPTVVFFLCLSFVVFAQKEDYEEKTLSLETEYQGYFTNNEFKRHIAYGYTLGGVRLSPKLSYTFSNTVKFYFGFSALKYWGANDYPLYNYTLIPQYDQIEDRQKLLHFLPYFRFDWKISEQTLFVMGNIDKREGHLLNVALWNPELNFAMDYEEGLQLKHNSTYWNNEIWLNWQNFNYINDVDRECFLLGIAGNLNTGYSKKHTFFFNYAFMWQHHGGELDTLTSLPLDHWLNGGFGFGYALNFNNKSVERLAFSFDWVYSKSLKNDTWFFKAGNGLFANISLLGRKYKVRLGYYYSEDMISFYGNPFFSNIAQRNEGEYYPKNKLLNASFSYSLYEANKMTINIFSDFYYKFDKKTNIAEESNNLSFSFGISMDFASKHLIKKI